jgi:hypothetical protein
MGYATPEIALNLMDNQFAQKPEGQAIMSSYKAVQLENDTPGMGWAQWLTAQGSNMLGQALNPLTWAGGGAGDLAATAATRGAESALPDAAGVFMRKPLKDMLSEPMANYVPGKVGNLSAGVIADKTLQNFGIGAGAAVPQSIVDNYNQDSNHIQWGGVAREAGEMGGFGIAIGAVPFAFGMLRGKVNDALGIEPGTDPTMTELDRALDAGHITPDEHQWYQDYLQQQKTPGSPAEMQDLQKRATQIVNDNGTQANTSTNEVPFDILKPDDIDNLKGVVADQVTNADMPEDIRTSLSDFVVNKRMDDLTSDPNSLDGVRGYVDFVNHKLEAKPEKLAEADQILDDHLMKSVKDNMPFSQKEIMKHIKQAGFEQSHLDQLPVTIPENIKARVKNVRDIDNIKKENTILQRKYERAKNQKYASKIKANELKIETLTKNSHDYLQKMNRSEEAQSHVKEWQDRIEKYKSENVKLAQLDKTIKSGKKFTDRIAANEQRIKDLEESAPKILTPKEELAQIRSDLLDNGLPRNFERSPQYHRLLDLSNVWHNAHTLLDRIHLEHEYNRQQAFSTLANQVLKIADSNSSNLAKPENVMDYLKKRIEGTFSKPERVQDVTKQVTESEKVPTDAESILDEQAARVRETQAEDFSKEYEAASDKFKEFKANDGLFKNLISCVLGGIGG